MKRIQTFLKFLAESAGHTFSVHREDLGDGNFEWSWLLDGREIGEMLVHLDSTQSVASIVSFMKRGDSPRGSGYRFIKMCIDELLHDGVSIVQADHTSNPNSQEVWRKLALEGEYVVKSTTWRGDPAKMLTKK